MSEKEKCPYCNAPIERRRERLTPGLVKAYELVLRKEDYHFSKDELNDYLTKSEAGNFQKLRYHALIAKDRDGNKGDWIFTRRGADWLKGKISIPKEVYVFRNRVVDHGKEYVELTDVLKGNDPYWESYETVVYYPVEDDDLPVKQLKGQRGLI